MSSQLKEQTLNQIWSKAKKHYAASSVGYPSDMENYELCQCCDQPIIKEYISMFQHSKQFEIFGFGYPLWFSFLKYCIVLVLVLVAARTGSSIYMATKQNYDFCYGQQTSPHQAPAKHQKPHHFAQHQLTGMSSIRARHFGTVNSGPYHGIYDTNIDHHLSNDIQFMGHFKQTQKGGHADKPNVEGKKSYHKGHTVQCTSFMIYLSIFKGEQMYNNEFLRILSFIIHLVALIGIRNNMQKEEQYYDERTCSLSDYSVIISNLPRSYGVKNMVLKLLREQFNKSYGDKDSEVREIIYVFKDEKLEHLQHEKKQLEQKRLKAIENNNIQQAEDIQKQIQNLEKQAQHQIEVVKGDIKRDYIKCDKVIVIMKTEGDKGELIQAFEQGVEKGRTYSEYFVDGTSQPKQQIKINIKEAPEPNQINWEHIDESDTARNALILRGWLLTFLFLAVVTVAFYFIMLAKTNLFVKAVEIQLENPNDPTARSNQIFATVIVFVALFGVILFNKFIMGKVLHIFVHMQRHAYTDKEAHSFAMKYSLGMFFTTALMTLAVEAITFKNFYSHHYGVIEEQTIMFYVTAFFIPLVWVIHPYNISKKIDLKMKENCLVTQQEANELIEDFPYDLGKRYAQVFEIMWFTFLYSELIPLGSFLVLIGLFFYYWIDKYNFLRRSALKAGVSGKMSLLGLKSLDATLFLAPAGRILFRFIMYHQIDYLSIILTVLGIIYLFVPVSSIIWFLNNEKFLLEQKTYDQAKHSFKQHYFTLHPVYKLTYKRAIKQFRKLVAEHYKEEFKKVRLYGSGRGNFVKGEDSMTKSKGYNSNNTNNSRI